MPVIHVSRNGLVDVRFSYSSSRELRNGFNSLRKSSCVKNSRIIYVYGIHVGPPMKAICYEEVESHDAAFVSLL